MISQFSLDVPCKCGHSHTVPLDLKGRAAFVCAAARVALRLRVDPAQFQTLDRNNRADDSSVEKTYLVHKAAEVANDQQRCEDCGVLLLSYRMFRMRDPHAPVAWWKPGDLVGMPAAFGDRDRFGGPGYFAQLPLSPHRERRCFQKVS